MRAQQGVVYQILSIRRIACQRARVAAERRKLADNIEANFAHDLYTQPSPTLIRLDRDFFAGAN